MNILNSISPLIFNKLISLPGLFIAITFHELAHGYTAYIQGDPTAKNSGRLTLNPLAHIDITGFLLLIIVGFGWAKPVPINPLYFKKRKLGVILVSISGPLTNLVIALLAAILLVSDITLSILIADILRYTILYNIVLGVFNLLPFPPLDGSKVVASLLPTKYEMLFYKYEKYLYSLLIILLITNTIDKVLGPLVEIGYSVLIRVIMLIF